MPGKKKEHTLSDQLQQLPYPAFELNEQGRFISRNKTVNPRLVPIRMQTAIDTYLSAADRKRLEELPVGMEALIDLQQLGPHGAIALRQPNGYLIAMRNLTAHLLNSLQQRGTDAPSFFSGVEQQIHSLYTNGDGLPKELRVLRKNFRKMLRYHLDMTMYLHYTGDTLAPSETFEAATLINSLLNHACRLLRPNGFRSELQTVEGPVFVHGSADELRYAVATMVASAAEHLRETHRLSILSSVLEQEYLVSVLFEPLFEGALYQAALSGRFEEGLSTAYANLFFVLRLLRKLAESNGWRFSIANAGHSEGFLRMTLALPLAEEQPLLFNEPPDSLPLLELLLSFAFPSPDED